MLEWLMLYSVQLKNMYSHLNSSSKLSDIYVISAVNIHIATQYHYTNSPAPFTLYIIIFSIQNHV